MSRYDKLVKKSLEEKLYQVVPDLNWKVHKGFSWFSANGYENHGFKRFFEIPKIKVYVRRNENGKYGLMVHVVKENYLNRGREIVDEVNNGLFGESIEMAHIFTDND